MNRTALAATAQAVLIADLEIRFTQMLEANNWIEPHEMVPYWNDLSVSDLQLAAMYFMAKAHHKAALIESGLI